MAAPCTCVARSEAASTHADLTSIDYAADIQDRLPYVTHMGIERSPGRVSGASGWDSAVISPLPVS